MATTRPRGFIDNWEPKPETLDLIDNVKSVLDANHDILPLTLRQIFYMLVSGYRFDKTELAYKRLCENMNKARRAQMIDMDDIRDDGLRRRTPPRLGRRRPANQDVQIIRPHLQASPSGRPGTAHHGLV